MNYEKSINFQVEGRKKSVCYSNCSLSKANTKGRLMAVNDKYLALAWKEIGMIKLVDLNNPNDQITLWGNEPPKNTQAKTLYEGDYKPIQRVL